MSVPCEKIAPASPWQQPSTARDPSDQAQYFEITHPFHPLLGKVYELVDRRVTWGEDRVYYHDGGGQLRRISTHWTSLADVDLFVVTSAGRSAWRLCDLLELVEVVARLSPTVTPARRNRKPPSASSK